MGIAEGVKWKNKNLLFMVMDQRNLYH
jgi:hypothetical protein